MFMSWKKYNGRSAFKGKELTSESISRELATAR